MSGEDAVDLGWLGVRIDMAGAGKMGEVELLAFPGVEEDRAWGIRRGDPLGEVGGGKLGNRREFGADGGLPMFEAFGGGIGAADDAPERTEQEEDHELSGQGPV